MDGRHIHGRHAALAIQKRPVEVDDEEARSLERMRSRPKRVVGRTVGRFVTVGHACGDQEAVKTTKRIRAA
jgi:hypothetical protein